MSGRIDLLVQDEKSGDLIIVDFKTSASRFSAGKLARDLQPKVYAYAMRQVRKLKTVLLRWDVLVRNKKPIVQHIEMARGPLDDVRLFELVKAAERGVKAGAFWPNDSSWLCGTCEFRDACSKWQDSPKIALPDSVSRTVRRTS